MRYLPLTDADRARDARGDRRRLDRRAVPRRARGRAARRTDRRACPIHASELSVERQLTRAGAQEPGRRRSALLPRLRRLPPSCPGERRPSDPARRVPDQPTRPTSPRSRRARCRCCSSSRPRSRGCTAARSPTPRCTTARPPAGKRSAWRGGSRGGRKAILSSGLHPHYVSVAKTMARFTGDELDTALPELDRRDRCRAADRRRSTARPARSSSNIPTSSAGSPTWRRSPRRRMPRARC